MRNYLAEPIPDRREFNIILHSVVWEVLFCPELTSPHSGEPLYGLCDSMNNNIYIRAEISDKEAAKVFLHEFYHGIVRNGTGSLDEETTARQMESDLFMLIPQLPKWILKAAHFEFGLLVYEISKLIPQPKPVKPKKKVKVNEKKTNKTPELA